MFDDMSSNDPNDWFWNTSLPTPEQNVASAVGNLYTRYNQVNGTDLRSIFSVQLWRSYPNANNQWVADLIPPSLTDPVPGVASSYLTQVYKGANRQKFVLNLYDSSDGKPQTGTGYSPTTLDDGTPQWWLLNSGIPFSTQDGQRLAAQMSNNTGYNRRLAKAYGRTLVP